MVVFQYVCFIRLNWYACIHRYVFQQIKGFQTIICPFSPPLFPTPLLSFIVFQYLRSCLGSVHARGGLFYWAATPTLGHVHHIYIERNDSPFRSRKSLLSSPSLLLSFLWWPRQLHVHCGRCRPRQGAGIPHQWPFSPPYRSPQGPYVIKRRSGGKREMDFKFVLKKDIL